MKPLPKIVTEPAVEHSFFVKQVKGDYLYTEHFIRLSYNRILIVESGSGLLIVDGHSFEISGNEVFLLAKGQIYQFEQQSEINGYCISFGDCFWEKTPSSASNCKAVLFNNALANQYLNPNDLELNEFLFLCKALVADFESDQYTNQIDVMAAYLKIIMIKLANIKLVQEDLFDNQDYLIYRKFMEILSNQYHLFHAVNDYAEMLNITPRRLSELCKRCSNKSAKEIINGQITAEAKRLLQFSSDSVKEIAYKLNFSTSEQFSHFFKKNTKASPVSYRNHFMNIGSEA